jgi:uncharacterized membrane-anchored protein
MISLKRPLGLAPLLTVLLTLIMLTLMLTSMVWSRISLLQNGTEVILKTAPVDPRDLLRGYFVRLNYNISRISPADLAEPMSKNELANGFKRHSQIFVKLQPDKEKFWTPVSIHRTIPKHKTGTPRTSQSVLIRGRVLYDACKSKRSLTHVCKISIRYGIEKFFAQKKRTRKLEEFARRPLPESERLDKQIQNLQKKYNHSVGNPNQTTEAFNSSEIKRISEKLKQLRHQRQQILQQNRINMAKRFAVLVRIDKHSGEAAISGLQLDGKRIYDERLF